MVINEDNNIGLQSAKQEDIASLSDDNESEEKIIPLSLEDAKTLIHNKHEISVSDDDPLLAIVTIHQAFIQDYERLLKQGRKEQKKIIEEAQEKQAKLLQSTQEAIIASLKQVFKTIEKPKEFKKEVNFKSSWQMFFLGALLMIIIILAMKVL